MPANRSQALAEMDGSAIGGSRVTESSDEVGFAGIHPCLNPGEIVDLSLEYVVDGDADERRSTTRSSRPDQAPISGHAVDVSQPRRSDDPIASESVAAKSAR